MSRFTSFWVSLCGLLLSVVFSTAYATTINVTTAADVDDPVQCSLRDAIQASATKSAIGGCAAGQQDFTDVIQLAPKTTYTLTRGPLVIAPIAGSSGGMEFQGGTATDPTTEDIVTATSPARIGVTSTIVAQAGQRIFDSSVSGADINLTAINLVGGTGTVGGAILAGGTVELTRVNISGATASIAGGAVYLEGALATLTATTTTFTNNNAPRGSVLAMSCVDNLIFTVRTIALTQTSITGNGSASSSSTLDFCGQPTADITSSTIARNIASTQDTVGLPAVIRIVDTAPASTTSKRLYPSSVMDMLSNTVTENTTPAALAYSYVNSFTLANNFLAFNSVTGAINSTNSSDYTTTNDCAYVGLMDTSVTPAQVPGGTLQTTNLFSSTTGTVAGSRCQLSPPTSSSSADTDQYTTSSQTLSSFLNPLGYYGGVYDDGTQDPLFYGYLPLDNLTTNLVLLDGASASQCGGADQRGLTRGSGKQVTINSSSSNVTCDIGAMELSILTANAVTSGANTSYASVIASTAPDTTGLTTTQAQTLNSQFQTYLTEYKTSYRYREAVMSITTSDFADEAVSGNTSQIGVLAPTPVNGKLVPSDYSITAVPDPSDVSASVISCTWDPLMNQLIASRTDGSVTPGGQKDSCIYTITNSKTGVSSSATAQFTISNIAPIANNDSYTLPFGASSIQLNILANDSDDGDGPVTNAITGKPTPGYPTVVVNNQTVQRPVFYVDNRIVNGQLVSIPANIIITTQPTQGHLVFQYSEPCANNNVNSTQNTCYGGTITYVNDNLFSPFNDSFQYQVLDADLTPSNTASVTIINSGTTTNTDQAGGGSVGFGALLGLMSLVLVRRRIAA